MICVLKVSGVNGTAIETADDFGSG